MLRPCCCGCRCGFARATLSSHVRATYLEAAREVIYVQRETVLEMHTKAGTELVCAQLLVIVDLRHLFSAARGHRV